MDVHFLCRTYMCERVTVFSLLFCSLLTECETQNEMAAWLALTDNYTQAELCTLETHTYTHVN